MPMFFDFSTATRIIFGRAKVNEVSSIGLKAGKKALLVYGASPERHENLLNSLDNEGISYIPFAVTKEPTLEIIENGVYLFRKEACEMVIAIGGGSVIDTGKTIALLSNNDGEIRDYLEVVGLGKEINHPGAFMIAIPTTAGTGSEVTRNAVIGVKEQKIKVSLRSNYLLPSVAIIDPELTASMPPNITASTGMDAITQLVEGFVSNKANPITDAFCQDGLQYAASSIREVYTHGEDINSRERMSLASLYSGIVLANAKLGAVHGFAGVIGGMYDAPHGEICAALLPAVMRGNIESLQRKKFSTEYLSRYRKIAQIFGAESDPKPEEAAETIYRLNEYLNIRPLSSFGISEADYPEIIVKAAASSSMKGNPVVLSPEEMYKMLEISQ
ncbi:MAG: iron-containing alcohol dehydrogenase [Chloroflexota bacterium]|nr:MAG: iron-containing alcohol dehydrogenase [Chloroflexota bacterium]